MPFNIGRPASLRQLGCQVASLSCGLCQAPLKGSWKGRKIAISNGVAKETFLSGVGDKPKTNSINSMAACTVVQGWVSERVVIQLIVTSTSRRHHLQGASFVTHIHANGSNQGGHVASSLDHVAKFQFDPLQNCSLNLSIQLWSVPEQILAMNIWKNSNLTLGLGVYKHKLWPKAKSGWSQLSWSSQEEAKNGGLAFE